MKYLFFIMSVIVMVSCSKIEDKAHTHQGYSEQIIDEYIGHLLKVGENQLYVNDEELQSNLVSIENVAYEGISEFEFCESVAKILKVDSKTVSDYLDFYSEYPEISSNEVIRELVAPRYEQLLVENNISLKKEFLLNQSQLRGGCNWWQASLAVLAGAGTLVTCGGCAGGVLPSCVACPTSAYGSYGAIKECFFN